MNSNTVVMCFSNGCIHLQLCVSLLAKMEAIVHLLVIVTAQKNGQEVVVNNVMNCLLF